jgi:hypothetical protein
METATAKMSFDDILHIRKSAPTTLGIAGALSGPYDSGRLIVCR